MLIALLLAIAPPERALPAGLPAPMLDRTPDQQARRAARADWQAFRSRWGSWHARWDERNGTPRYLSAPGVGLADIDGIVEDIARLSRVPVAQLTEMPTHTRGTRQVMVWQRRWRGAVVEGDEVVVVADHGRIAGVRIRLTPIRLAETPESGEVVFVDADGRPWLTTRQPEGDEVVYRDRGGGEVYRYDTRRYAEVLVSHEERTVGDAIVQSPARNIEVADAEGTIAHTDASGQHTLTGDLTALLSGPELVVTRRGEPIEATGTGDIVFINGQDMPLSAGTVQHHFHVVWDWLKQRWPDHAWLTEQVSATVEAQGGTCNAYYTNGTITFLPGNSQSCNNFGQIADVVYHEVGHGIHDYIRVAGIFAGDISEGSADYISATILDDPVLAPNARLDGSAIREIDTDRIYPDDVVGQVHTDGLIWASFMWNLREKWQEDYGEEAGAQMADLILLGALELGPSLTDIDEAVLLADDDDGDPTNGTPHDCELIDLLNQHGIGPGTVGVLAFDHDPLAAQASATDGYPVSFDVTTWPPACAAFDGDSVGLWFTTDEGADLSGEDPDAWQPADLTRSGDTWSGDIPRQPAGVVVRYFLSASSADGTEVITTHGGREDDLFSFRIGDREELVCADFEDGAADWSHGPGFPWFFQEGHVDDWMIDVPTGAPDTPSTAAQGARVAGTRLEGAYTPSNRSYLQSPVWEITDPGPMLMLSYQRYLTVEDAYYDEAKIWLGKKELWRNPASESGTDAHLLDTDWTLHDLPLEGVEGAVSFTWTLDTDGGLQYGGWAVDHVCLVQLADAEGHYRTPDLVATDEDSPVSITWSQPWVSPLSATILVRSADGWPTGPEDGVIIDVDLTPTPGEARSAIDDDAAPGESFYYALFVAGADDTDWYMELVEGENADIGGVASAEDTGDSGAGEDEDTGEAPAPEGCGCGGGAAVVWGPLAVLFALRRRESAHRI